MTVGYNMGQVASKQILLLLSAFYGGWLGSIGALDEAKAQITADNTLPNPTRVEFENNTFQISQGTQVGGNLFHSFQSFSIPTGSKASFRSNPAIKTLFSRVTGSAPSNIDGLLESNGTADFFLINSNGVIFGPQALLNVGGSFISTTAEQIKFSDGILFSVKPTNNSLLSVSIPSGLQFGQSPKSIVNSAGKTNTPDIETTGLKVAPNQTLALIGGPINIPGGRLFSPQSQILLTSVGTNAFVSLAPNDLGYRISHDNIISFQDITLSELALIDSSGLRSGAIQLQGKDISVLGGSRILATTTGAQKGNGIDIKATRDVRIIGTAPLETPFLDGSSLRLGVFSPQRSSVTTSMVGAPGTAGDINIESSSVAIQNGGRLSSRSIGPGTGGNIKVTASDSVVVTGQAPLLGFEPSLVEIARGAGQAPEFYAEGFTSTVISMVGLATGKTQDVTIETGQLLVSQGGIISTGPLSSGAAGNLYITATEIEVNGASKSEAYPSAITVAAIPGTTGLPGELFIDTNTLRIKAGARLGLDTTKATGARGTIKASDLVEISGKSQSQVFESRISGQSSLEGIGGTVDLETQSLLISNGGSIFVEGLSEFADGGDIKVIANSVLLDNDAEISTASGGRLGGNISLKVKDVLLLRRNSKISARAGDAGTGGNIEIEADLIASASSEDNDIIANAVEGPGGNIDVTAQGILGIEARAELTPNSDINASSQVGIDGTVTINSPDTELDTTPVELSEDISPPPLKQSCQAVQIADDTFVVSGRGGLADNPVALAATGGLWQDIESLEDLNLANQPQLQPPSHSTSVTQPPQQKSTHLTEAQSWAINSKGKVQLIASDLISASLKLETEPLCTQSSS